VTQTTIEFDLACFMSCEEGRGFRVANDNPATRTVAVSAGALFASVDSDGEYWFEPFETAAFFEGLGTHWDAWIYINEGEVTHVVPTGPMGCIVATGEIDWVAELPATDLVAFNDLGLITSSSDTNRFYWGVDGWQSSDRLTGKAHALWLGRVVAASGSAVGIGTYVHEWTGSSWTTTSLDFVGDEAGVLAMSKDRILMSGRSNRNAIVHVLRPSGTSWEIEDTITLGKGDDWHTWAGTIDGDTFAVSDTGQDSGHSGVVRIYQRAGSVWTLTETLTSRRDTRNFGSSLDLDGDRLVVLADGATPGPSSAGGLYLYTRSGGRWTLEVLDERGSGFGFGARIDGDTIVAAGAGSGREPTLWVYIRTTDGWQGTPIQAGSADDWVNGVDVVGDDIAVSMYSALLIGRLR
jgi:hypothetical protein